MSKSVTKIEREIRENAQFAEQIERSIAALARIHRSLLAYRDVLRDCGQTWTHAASALVLVQREAEVAYDDLEFHLSKIHAADANPFVHYPKTMKAQPGEVACWACRRGPSTNPDHEGCVLGDRCRSAR